MKTRRLCRSLVAYAILITLIGWQSARAQCCDAEPSSFRQPDGTVIEVHFHGNERYTRTTSSDGYTLVFDHAAGAYHYARLNAKGDAFVSTGRLAKGIKPADLPVPRHLELNPAARGKLAEKRFAELEAVRQDKEKWRLQKEKVGEHRARGKRPPAGGERKNGKGAPIPEPDNDGGSSGDTDEVSFAPPVNPPTLGDVLGLTILVDFSDVPARSNVTRADMDDYCNKPGGRTGWGNKGSAYDYFYAQSNGRLRYNNNVTYYVRVPHPYSYYNDTSAAQNSGTNGRRLLTDALNQLLADGYDFSGLTANTQGRVIATNLFWAGNDSGVWASGLWPHRWSLSSPLNVGGGLYVFDYQCTDIGSSGNPTIGTFCHENGHLIGKYPDYYDTNSGNGSSNGVGAHCLMGSGNHSSQTNPTNISGYLKYHSGWMDAVELTGLTPPIRLAAAVDGSILYKYTNTDPGWTNEYFLIENRTKIGGWESTSGLPDSGLMISHVHQTGSNGNQQMTEANHYEHSIEQADGLFSLEASSGGNRGNNTDYFHSGGTGPKTEFSDSTLPNAKWWKGADGTAASGTNSGLHIHSVTDAASVMTFTYGTGTPSAAAATRLTTSVLENAVDYGGTAMAQSFAVYNSGGGTVTYNISDDAAWLTCNPTSGTATTETDSISVTYTTSALTAGTYNATITVDGGAAGSQLIAVTLTVRDQPILVAAPSSLSVAGLAGFVGPGSEFDIENTGGGTAAYTITKTQPWLTILPASGTVGAERDTIAVLFDATSLPPGTYNDTITVNSTVAANPPIQIPVSFTVDGSEMILGSPDGGEKWVRGTTQTISWVSGLGGNVRIELLKNGLFSSTVTASAPNNGSFAWAIPGNQTPASNYRIRITSVETPGAFDESFADFAIAPAPTYFASMETNPGWTLQGAWAWGQPAGSGGDPNSGFTGDHVIGYNLSGQYTDNLPETHATTPAIDCSEQTNVQLSFRRWLGVESGNYDKAYIRVSNDGITWTNVFAHSSSGNGTIQESSWSQQTYDISAIADGQSTVYVRWTMGTTDSSVVYGGWNIDDVVIDGDYVGGGAGLVIAESGGSTDVAEGGGTDTYTIALATLPGADVTISVTPDSQVGVSPVSLTFTNANWATPQTVTVTAENDADIEFSPHTGSILHGAASSDADYNGISLDGILVNVIDNDNNAPVVNAGPDQVVFLTGSAWTPLELAPKLWLDADDDASITLNGATVSQWADKSGFGRHATAAGTSQPTNTPAGLNGKRVLTFDGGTDVLNVDLDFLAGVSHSAFIVAKPTVYSNIYGAANASAGANSLHVGFGSATNYRMNYWSNDYTPALTSHFRAGSANILHFAWTTGVGKEIFANGGPEGSNTSAGVIGTMSGGGRIGRATGHPYFGGDIAEFIAITGTVSVAQRQSLEGYLAHKWSLSDWLPLSHPYKTTGPNNAEATASLDGTASDADNHPLATLWTLVSGPAGVAFGDANAIDTSMTFTAEGIYTLRLTADDGYTQTSDDVVITVNPAGEGYSVTYTGNGSTGGSVPVDTANPYDDGAMVTVLGNTGALVRTGYTFNGWNTAAEGTGTDYAAGSTFTITSHTTLHARWTPDSYTVTFDKQGGSGGDDAVTATFGSAMPPATAPTLAGHSFGGYHTEVSGGGVQYYTAAMSGSTNWDIASDTTLLALWIPNSYTVTFDANGGGTPSPATKAVTFHANYGSLATVSRAGHTFGGWFTAETGGTEVTDATMVTNAADHTVYARWTLNTYTVAYDGNTNTGGSPPADQTKTHGITLGLSDQGSLAKTGHSFTGWNTEADGSGTLYASGGNYSIDAPVTLYARWTPDTYIITYDGNGSTSGSVPPAQTKTYAISLTVSEPGTLARGGYLFAGWNTAADGSGDDYAPGSTFSENMERTLYAQWSLTVTLFQENFESPSTPTGYAQGTLPNNGKWVGANQGFNSSYHGIIDKAGGGFSAPDPNMQAYAFRYSNSGLTTSQDTMGDLDLSFTYTVNVDVVRDIAATPYNIQLIAFAPGAPRNDCRATPSGSVVLASASGNAPADGSFRTVSFTFVPDAVTHAAYSGYDLGLRFIGGTTSANVDNVLISATGAGAGGVDHFAISPIASPQTVGSEITGITITALSADGGTAASFNGTVTFGGTAGVTGTSGNFIDGVLNGVSFTPMVAGNNLTFTVDDGEGSTGSVTIAGIASVYQSWAVAAGLTGGNADPNTSPDGDLLANLQEFAFGTDPTVENFNTLEFVVGGEITSAGSPIILDFAQPGEPDDEYAVFGRIKNHLAAGLSYTVEFSADLKVWTATQTIPTVLTNENNVGDLEVVGVPFSGMVPVSDGGQQHPPQFMRVTVSMD